MQYNIPLKLVSCMFNRRNWQAGKRDTFPSLSLYCFVPPKIGTPDDLKAQRSANPENRRVYLFNIIYANFSSFPPAFALASLSSPIFM